MSQCVFAQLPLLDKLAKASPKERKKILEKANFELIKSIIECTQNVLNGNVELEDKCFIKLKKHKKILRRINSAKEKLKQKKEFIIQNGGAFLPALLSPIIGILLNRLIT